MFTANAYDDSSGQGMLI
jgi:hypothetical protein